MDEQDRLAIHELGHALISMVWLGKAGTVELSRQGGRCRPVWPKDAQLTDDDAAVLLMGAHVDAAGWCAEQLVYGLFDSGSASDDVRCKMTLAELRHDPDWSWVTQKLIEHTTCFLLKRHRQALTRAVAIIYQGTTDSRRLTDFFSDIDKGLAAYHDEPLLTGDWASKWLAIKRAAGVAYAREALGLGV